MVSAEASVTISHNELVISKDSQTIYPRRGISIVMEETAVADDTAMSDVIIGDANHDSPNENSNTIIT